MSTLLAIPAGAFAAARISVLADDETDRRLTLLLAGPLTRVRLLTTQVAVAAAGCVLLLTVAGLAFWAGARLAGAQLAVGAVLAGTVNVLPIALLCLGASVLALGRLPGAVTLAGALPGAGGFLWLVITQSVQAPRRAVSVSPFAHLAAVPAEPPAFVAQVVMLAVAGTLVAIGAVTYRSRDLQGG